MAAPLPEADRRRLLEVRGLHPAVPVLVLHPLLTVVTGFGRDASDTVVECLGRLGAPLGPAVSGTVEIGGRVLELSGAFADLAARPEVVRAPMIVSELGRRRAAEAAVDVSQRAARVSRREAGLARRDQLVDRLEQLSNRAGALEQQLQPGETVDDGEIQRLLIAARLPDPATPNPIITGFIDEWDALVAERKATSGGPTTERAEANLGAILARIAERESGIAGGGDSEMLSAEGVAGVQAAHAAVERLACGLEDRRRSERRVAGREVAAALETEREALTDLGFDSYAAFLLALAEGRAEGDGAHDAAAVRTAESALARARDRENASVLFSERELDLRSRVARLLGRLSGPDVGAELRAGREMIGPASGARDRLEHALRSAGVPIGDDPTATAERYLTATGSRRARRAALKAELAEIESEGSRLDEQLELAENELAVAERELIAGVAGSLAGREAPLSLGSVEPAELAAVITALVAPAGPPVVVGECFAELTTRGCAAVLEVLSEVSRHRQVVVVTEHDAVGRWAQGLGINGVVWTPAEAEAAQRTLRAQRSGSDGVAPDAVAPDGLVPDGLASAPPDAPRPIDTSDAPAPAPSVQAADAATPTDEPVGAVVVEPEPEPEPEHERAPATVVRAEPLWPMQPSRAAGLWKAQRRIRRKAKTTPPTLPWEGRFDTGHERALPTAVNPATAPPPGLEPLAVCARHNGAMTRKRCARCAEPACDECLVTPRGRSKAICIECAILDSGVRKRRRLRG